MELGYRVVEIAEVYHFDSFEQLDIANSGLFTGYINAFLKTKQEVGLYFVSFNI